MDGILREQTEQNRIVPNDDSGHATMQGKKSGLRAMQLPGPGTNNRNEREGNSELYRDVR